LILCKPCASNEQTDSKYLLSFVGRWPVHTGHGNIVQPQVNAFCLSG
jgi:hypothetical protein